MRGSTGIEIQALLHRIQRLLDVAEALDDGTDVLPDAVDEVYAFVQDDLLPGLTSEAERLAARLGELRDEAATRVTPASRQDLRQVLHALHAVLAVHLVVERDLYVPLLGAERPATG